MGNIIIGGGRPKDTYMDVRNIGGTIVDVMGNVALTPLNMVQSSEGVIDFFTFNGANSKITTDIAANTVFQSGNGFTVITRVRQHTVGEGAGRIFTKADNDSSLDGITVWNGATRRYGANVQTGGAVYGTDYVINYNTWQTLIITFTNLGYITIYLDSSIAGGEGQTAGLDEITSGNDLVIGNKVGPTDRTLDGDMEYIQFIPRVITHGEMISLFNENNLILNTIAKTVHII